MNKLIKIGTGLGALYTLGLVALFLLNRLNAPAVAFIVILFGVSMGGVHHFLQIIAKGKIKEERLAAIVENMPMVVSMRDKADNIIYTNGEALDYFGLNQPEEYSTRFAELSPQLQPDGSHSLNASEDIFARAQREGKFTIEWMHKHLGNDQLLPSELTFAPVNLHGQDYLVAFVRDLRAYHALQAREQEVTLRIQQMFDHAPIAINYWTADYQVMECNMWVVEAYGLSSKAEYMAYLSGRLSSKAPNKQDAIAEWRNNIDQAFAKGSHHFRFVEELPDGRTALVDMFAQRMVWNGQSVVVTYGTDVTQQERNILEMRELEGRMQLMLNASPVACYLIDNHFKAIDCNNETLALFNFGSKEEAISGFDKTQLCTEAVHQKMGQAMVQGAARFGYTLKSTQGEEIPCEITFILSAHQGKSVVIAYIFDLRDLNTMLQEREKLVELEANNRAKDQFLARMSHEIRTPISAILGISEIELQQTDLHFRVEESFAKINDTASILLNIVNDILDISKVEAGQLPLIEASYPVATLINDTTQLHMAYQGSKLIQFTLTLGENIPTQLVGDQLRIKQILSNLLSNAFKYTAKGSIALKFAYETGHLVITIADTGLGMTPEQVEVLFEEYSRFHEGISNVKGTGLGMSIVRHLLHMMQAKIDIESQPNVGTTIVVRIPQPVNSTDVIEQSQIESLERFDVNTNAKKFNFTPEPMPYGKVLVVDDIEANLYVACGLLGFYSLNVETCTSGQDAIDKVAAGSQYHIIFMDHTMPGLSGTETMEKLREMGYDSPIIVLTANALIGHSEEFLKRGFDGFISKPINTSHLNQILIKYIKNKYDGEVAPPATPGGAIGDYMYTPEVRQRLQAEFVKTQKDAVINLRKALAEDNFEDAYRYGHSLKGLAGLIDAHQLVATAQIVEDILRDKNHPTPQMLDDLEAALAGEVASIGVPDNGGDAPGVALSNEEITIVFDQLEPLLAKRNATAKDMLPQLMAIPAAGEVASLIEGFDLKKAYKALQALREELGV